VASIDIDRLVEWEEDVTRYDGGVHRGIEFRDACPSEAGNKFGDVTDALCSNRRVSRPITIPELKVYTGMWVRESTVGVSA
jgi:hypothetical protein